MSFFLFVNIYRTRMSVKVVSIGLKSYSARRLHDENRPAIHHLLDRVQVLKFLAAHSLW